MSGRISRRNWGRRHRGSHVAIEGHAIAEFREGALYLVDRPVVLKMLGVDVRDHRHRRVQGEERIRRAHRPPPPDRTPVPQRAFVPLRCSMPPTILVAPMLATSRMALIIDVVVVLPWVPPTATAFGFSRIRVGQYSSLAMHHGNAPCLARRPYLGVVFGVPRRIRRRISADPTYGRRSCPAKNCKSQPHKPFGNAGRRQVRTGDFIVRD